MADLVLDSGPIDQPLKMYQGDRYELFFRVYQLVWNEVTEEFEKGPYIVLTGYTPKAEIKTKRGPTVAVTATFACSLSDQILDPGGVLCVLLPSESEKLTAETYVYDVQLSLDADHITTYITGDIEVQKQVTSGA